MKNMSCRDVLIALAVLGATSVGMGQTHSQGGVVAGGSPPAVAAPGKGSGVLAGARVFGYDQMPVRTMANGGESRDIAHGTLATGESVNLHQSMQVVGATPNPPHAIQHSEFILVREGELEFDHEVDGKMVAERVGPGGAIYVAFGTMHTVKNVGTVPAKYFVVAIGGDAK